MNNPETPPENNDNSLRTILRAINFSQGQLSLIFLRCNYAKLRQQIAAQLQEISSIPIREIILPEAAKSLYDNISQELGNEQPQAVMISGLNSVKNIDSILSLSNQIREEFRKSFPFPILIWIDDQILKKIIRVAPDLENWGSIIDFENDTADLIDFLQETTQEIFTNDVIPTPQIYKEIESARQDLQDRGEDINPEIQASLDLAFGLREYQQDHLDDALIYYRRSCEFWQIHHNLERHGILLVKISLAYSRKAEISNTENQEHWQNAKDNLQQALDIFEQAKRLDLVVKHINHLGEILRHLKAWTELEILAQRSLKLYENLFSINVETIHEFSLQNRQIGLCQNYGFLAEVSLKNQSYQKANQQAQQALNILGNIPNIQSQEYGLYRLFIARSHIGLGEISAAIENLETAKNESHPQYDPKLYIDILEQLNLLYFQEKQYLKAFEIKQKRLQIKQQYGFVAFVGASYLNPQRKVINSENSDIENTGTIAQEISASGRENDVKRLRGRIAGNEHKLTVIHGQSGVGKSSILQGGLIPALQQEPIGEREAFPILLRVYTNWVEILGKDLKIEINEYSTDAIIQQLQKNEKRNLLTVLIFDQFEEFFFVYTDQKQRRQFYDFLRVCLDIPFVKIVLSLREDYLHYLLELDRLVNLTVTNNNILDKNIRYYLGNFSPADAKAVIKSLTEKTRFYLQIELIDELVKDLAGDIGEVRPIELQIVGTQLQSEQIKTLDQYREFGKEKLVEKFLEDVIKDCGADNEQIARLVLYLLTDENGTRPLKTRAELAAQFIGESENLDLVLNIFVASGLVLLLPETPADRYQLVHDYLVEFIRQQQGNELLAELNKTKVELKQQQEATKILANAKIKADEQIQKGQKRLKISSGLAVGFLVIAGLTSVYSMNQFREADIAKRITKIEQSGVNIPRQFKLDALTSLVTGIQNGKALKNIVKDGRPLEQYPTISPIYTLNTILDDIQERNQLQGHDSPVRSVSFSPDGKTIATASGDKTARLWNLQGKMLQQFKHPQPVLSLSFSPDGKTIATASSDHIARLWNLKGQLLQEFKGHQDSVWSISFSPNGKTIATSSRDKTARLWNLKGELLQEFKGHKSDVNSVSFSPDGNTIATASDDKTARLWNLKGEKLKEFQGHRDSVRSVSFSPDGRTIATASSDQTARLWNLKGELLQEFQGHQSYINSVSFSPDGQTIATASLSGTARLWNLKGEMLQEFIGHQDSVNSLSFSPDGNTIATASSDQTVRLWNLNRKLLQEFKGHQQLVESVSFNPDGKTIATASQDKTARLWNLQGEVLQEFKHPQPVLSLSFSPDGKTIATGSSDHIARLWNLKGELLQEFKGHQEAVNSISFSPDGKTIASASFDKTVQLWNLQGKLLQKIPLFKGDSGYIIDASFSPDGQSIATGSLDHIARLWNLKGELLQEFKGHGDSVRSVSFSRDGKTIATASADKTVRLWNLQGKLLPEFKGHLSAVNSVSFSRDGQTIATASDDNTARLWNLKGELLQEFKGHRSTVKSVSFSPDGKTIATASWDNTARLWPVRNLDKVIQDGCDWLKDYLQNPNVGLSEEERRLCDDVKLSESGYPGFKD